MSYKPHLIFWFLIIFPFAVFSQPAPEIEFQRCLGGTKNEDGSALRSGLVEISDGSYVLAAITESNDGDVTGYHDLHDAWIVKINSSGTIEWQKCIGSGLGNDVPCNLIKTSDNGFIVAGYTSSQDITGFHGGIMDAWVFKLDSFGSIEWQKCYGGSKTDYAASIIQTSDGGYAFTGFTASNDGDVFGNHLTISPAGDTSGYEDMWVVKLTSGGEIEWQYCAGGSNADYGESIIQTSEGEYVASGFSWSQDEGFGNHGWGDGYVIKLSSKGGFLWHKTYGGEFTDYINSILIAPEGGYIFVGVKNEHSVVQTTSDLWIMKVDALGKTVWEKTYGGTHIDGARSINYAHDGGYVIAGSTRSVDGDVSGNHSGQAGSDIWILKITDGGALEWQKCLGGTDIDDGYRIIQTTDGGYAVNGRTYSNDGDVSGNHSVLPSKIDHWFVKLKPETKSVEQGNGATGFKYAYPNPTSDNVQFFVGNSEQVKGVQFYSILGEECYPQYTLSDNVLTADLSGLPNGSYVARIAYQGEDNVMRVQTQKFIYYSK
jgi:hypothetical protein